MRSSPKISIRGYVLLWLALCGPAAGRPVSGASVTFVRDAVNGVAIHKAGHTLLVYGDPTGQVDNADMVLFTHHRRDVVWAGRSLVDGGAASVVPAGEVAEFTRVAEFWSAFTQKRFHDYQQQGTKILAEPLAAIRLVKGGDVIVWQDLPIRVLDTPGYTRGAVSYLVEVDGLNYAFVGDLIYGDGKLFDLYSLQDAIPEAQIGGYHGWAGRLGDLLQSLRNVKAQRPDILIPARGPEITNPDEAIDRLIERAQAVYANYLSINAGRWFFRERYDILARRILGSANRIDWMPYAAVIHDKPPDWIIPIHNSRLLVAQDKSGFLVDCGSRAIIEAVKKLLADGTIRSLDGLFITHYHDDHTDRAFELVRDLSCPVYACRPSADILVHPRRYRLPALTDNPIANLQAVADGEQIRWREFDLTMIHFPGQTIYHDALLAQKNGGQAILFLGDSFTPSGIDDYCLLNRNLLGEDRGYFHCLDRLEDILPPEGLCINQHVLEPFRFRPDQIERMRRTLREREILLADLFPWPEVNFGIDERWARFYPYGQTVKSGQEATVEVRILNHLDTEQTYAVRLHGPRDCQFQPDRRELSIPAGQEAAAVFSVTPPAEDGGKVAVITADVAFGQWDLRFWCEALIEIETDRQ
ncbi:MAG: MBL fold metallo-hydrolase [Sedimentisphaerales bacterium]|nr:MBL fold metallo-hydrolase [Sedimentisphaerales bacterium]